MHGPMFSAQDVATVKHMVARRRGDRHLGPGREAPHHDRRCM